MRLNALQCFQFPIQGQSVISLVCPIEITLQVRKNNRYIYMSVLALNSICSTKWATPLLLAVSHLEPASIHNPTVAVWEPLSSVATRIPFSSVVTFVSGTFTRGETHDATVDFQQLGTCAKLCQIRDDHFPNYLCAVFSTYLSDSRFQCEGLQRRLDG